MIIDEILDTKEQQKFLNIDYIKKEAKIFNFDNITKAINEQNADELKTALKEYVTNNSYNKKLLKDIDKFKITFEDPETTKANIIEEIETTLFYTDELKKIILELFEDMEQPNFNEFVNLFNFEIAFNDYNDTIKFEILKNYCSIDNLNQAKFETIKNEFLQDILNCFVKCGV